MLTLVNRCPSREKMAEECKGRWIIIIIIVIVIRHSISLEPAFWVTLPLLHSTVDCTVGGPKEGT